ncbi:hypothetical protein U8V72_19955 [Priestia filamentosa]|uniref:hypothetical protein n=1 Tax=Priestia filamentosa TaxID=1402861 RepID=UPI00397D0735
MLLGIAIASVLIGATILYTNYRKYEGQTKQNRSSRKHKDIKKSSSTVTGHDSQEHH